MKNFNRLTKKDFVMDEDLEPFWRNLSGLDQKRWYANELYHRNKVGRTFLDDDQLEILRKAKRGKHYIMNIYNYSLLTNHYYADLLYYTQLERRFLYENAPSDFVSRILFAG